MYQLLVGITSQTYSLERQTEDAITPKSEAPAEIEQDFNFLEIKAQNRLLNNWEILQKEVVLRSFPEIIFPDLCSLCNLRCLSCSFHGPQKILSLPEFVLDENDYERLKEVLPYAYNVGIFGSGEPLLSPWIARVLHDGTRYRCLIDLATNGSLLHSFDRMRFDESLLRLVISLDAASPETLRRLRPGAILTKIIRGIQEVKSRYPRLAMGLNCIVSRGNVDELFKIINLAARLKLDFVTFNPLMALPDSDFSDILALRPADLPLFHEQVRRIRKKTVARSVTVSFGAIAASTHVEDYVPLHKSKVFKELSALEKRRSEACNEGLVTKLAEIEENLEAIFREMLPFFTEEISQFEQHAAPLLNDPQRELARLTARVDEYAESLEVIRQSDKINIPYCLAPFKASVLVVNGEVRPCCLLVHNVANGTERAFVEIWNGPLYQKLRYSMFDTTTLFRNAVSAKSAPFRLC